MQGLVRAEEAAVPAGIAGTAAAPGAEEVPVGPVVQPVVRRARHRTDKRPHSRLLGVHNYYNEPCSYPPSRSSDVPGLGRTAVKN